MSSTPVTTQLVQIDSIEQFREMFAGHLQASDRTSYSVAMPKTSGADSTSGLINHVFGAANLASEHKALSDAMFPVKVQLTTGAVFTVNTDIVIGPMAAPYAIQVDSLIFDGGSLTVLGTSLTIQTNSLTMKAGSPNKPYHVGILGVQGNGGANGSAGQPYSAPAQAGHNASAPTPGICTGASNGGGGSAGSAGVSGGAGGQGANGMPSMPATLSIGLVDPSSTTPFVVFTQSGAGGSGGAGGAGGAGQNGGAGGNGCDSGCEGTDGGAGGAAGTGGNGGTGGIGGNGVAGYPISITFPSASQNMLQTISAAASFGAGGMGGAGGAAGNPGGGGSGGKHKSDGANGGGATAGNAGQNGASGTQSGAPGNINVTYK